ncbi:putative membrane protein YccC [Nocardia sp. GAS34]|uniref:FUSC family protein n=1 Tax=unclassified Nocardia TaxID=2637762 RepID=UPI003D1B03A6
MIELRARVARLWSMPAALRALRAALVVPGLFALTAKAIGNMDMATFAAFGGFATLVMASFGGSRRDKLLGHLGLAVVGSVLLAIGTVVHTIVWLAVVVTLVVGFAVLFAGVIGPNVAAGGTAALLAFVLPAASPGAIEAIPSRLAGWWLASIVGTAAVLLISPRPNSDGVRAAAATLARALADRLDAALADCEASAPTATAAQGRGVTESGALAVQSEPTASQTTAQAARVAAIEAKHRLLEQFNSGPNRPTGLTAADQALTAMVGMLEWIASVMDDCLSEHADLTIQIDVEQALFVTTATVLREVAGLLDGSGDGPRVTADLERLERALDESVTTLRHMDIGRPDYADAVDISFHARTIGLGARTAALQTLTVAGLADYAVESPSATDELPAPRRRLGILSAVGGVTLGHASLRSVWFLNAMRGALGLAAATAVADISGVQHAFWVVLGTMSVLRTSASTTGATALRALAGTVLGFVVGAALLLAIGTGPVAMWIALPVVSLIAAYAPGVAPFAVGQAAFTLTVSVLYNLIVPVGWQVGVLRVQDVAIGCLVSVVVGALFWPRGAGQIVRDDLSDAFHQGGHYLAGAVEWALGMRNSPPDQGRTLTADMRLEEAVRGYLAERGTKRMPREHLWRLVTGTTRLRLTAQSLAGLPHPDAEPDPVSQALHGQSAQLALWFDELGDSLVGRAPLPAASLVPPELDTIAASASVSVLPCTLWVEQHIQHVNPHLAELVEAADELARQRALPWWK